MFFVLFVVSSNSSSPLRAIALMGATGSGKSALAMQLCRPIDAAIVACDSMQLYRGLDIGTAKPTRDEQAEVRHHLIDTHTLPAICSAAEWAELARAAIRAENMAGRTPLIVGGTGFYLRALLQGFADIPPEEPDVRAALQVESLERGIVSLYQELVQIDPVTAARLSSHDTQRILRALAVFRSSGRTLSDWTAAERLAEPIECPVFVLDIEREELHSRIARRFESMLAAGWLDEIKWLMSLDLPQGHPAMRAVGYRQLLDHFAGTLSLDEAVEAGIAATRHYAKRQATWFRHQTPEAIHGDRDLLTQLIQRALSLPI